MKKSPDPKERQREIARLEQDVEELRRLAEGEVNETELERLRREVAELKQEFYTHLGVWQRAQIARHPQRPYTLDFIRLLFTDFMELHGDRAFAEDPAIVAGFARFHGRPVAVLWRPKRKETQQRLLRQFQHPQPEGYRKAPLLLPITAEIARPGFPFLD